MKVDVKMTLITMLIGNIVGLVIGYFFGRTGLPIVGILCVIAISCLSCFVAYQNLKGAIKPKEEETKSEEEIKKEQ